MAGCTGAWWGAVSVNPTQECRVVGRVALRMASIACCCGQDMPGRFAERRYAVMAG